MLAPGARIVVTGGHGFVGRHVVTALAAAGLHPVSVVHPDGETLDLPGESVALDLVDLGALRSMVDGAEAVVHLAARAGGIQFQQRQAADVFRENRNITDAVLATASAVGVGRVFLASSLVVYRSADEPLTEDHPLLGPADAPSAYAWSKISDEAVSRWYPDLEAVIGRFGNVYGPGAPFDPQRSTVVHALIDRAARLSDGAELEVWGDGSAVRSFVFVEDVARAVVSILVSGVPGVTYNVDSGVPVTIADLAGVVREAVNPSLKIQFALDKPSGAPVRYPAINRLSALGYVPQVELSEGVAATVEWYRATVGS